MNRHPWQPVELLALRRLWVTGGIRAVRPWMLAPRSDHAIQEKARAIGVSGNRKTQAAKSPEKVIRLHRKRELSRGRVTWK